MNFVIRLPDMKNIKHLALRFAFFSAIAILLFAGCFDAPNNISYADHRTGNQITSPNEHRNTEEKIGTYKESQAARLVDTIYGDFNADIEEVIEILSMKPESYPTIWNMIKGVSDAIIPVGFTVAAVFILLSFLNKAMLFQLRSYEDIAKILLYMMMAKVLLQSSFELLGFIYSATASLISTAAITPESVMTQVNREALIAEIADMGLIEMLMYKMETVPVQMIMGLVKILIKVIAYGRLFELYVYTAVAPLPLATIAAPEHHQIAKRFIQAYIGVCMQGLIMMLSCVIFSALSAQLLDPTIESSDVMSMGGGGFLMASCVLLFVLVKSGSWGKTVTGLM